MKKNIEAALKTFLSSEQISALKEEISGGIRKINSAVDNNEKIKAKKDLMIQTFHKIDELIENSNRSPALFKTFYSVVKSNVKRLIQPIIEEMMEEEQIKNLDDIPDIPNTKTEKPESENPQEVENKQMKADGIKQSPQKKKNFRKKGDPERS